MKTFEEFQKQYGIEQEIDRFTKDQISGMLVPHVSTGVPQLDRLLGGGFCAGVIMLGGHSGMGKSTLALQIAENISAQDIPVFFYSLEMTRSGVIAKAIARQIYRQSQKKEALSSSDLLYQGSIEQLDKKQWKEINQAREIVKSQCRDLMILENRKGGAFSGKMIYEEVSGYAEKGNAVVFVDYLQVLKSSGAGGDPRNIIDENVRYLRQLAQEMEIPVVVINSLNRNSYGRSISVSAFKESGSIEYSADVVLAMQFATFSDHGEMKNGESVADKEKAKSPRSVDLIALKQRYGRCGEDARARFHYYAEHDYFEESESPALSPKRKKCSGKTETTEQEIQLDPEYDSGWMEAVEEW